MSSGNISEKCLTLSEAAEVLGVALCTIRDRVKSGELAAFSISPPDAKRHDLRIAPSAVRDFIAARTIKKARKS